MTTAVIGSIVLRGDEQVPVELRDLAGPRLGVVVGILARRRRQELIQGAAVVLGEVDELELGVVARSTRIRPGSCPRVTRAVAVSTKFVGPHT